MATELFAADLATTSVTGGGTTAPSSGTAETWTVASSAMFGAAVTGASLFHVADALAGKGTELIAVTAVSGTTWTVTRGADGTTPVTHSAGFQVVQTVPASWLALLAGLTGSATVLTPSGDTSGITDSAAIAAAHGSAGHVVLTPGAWYIGAPVLSTSERWLQGSGPATVINVIASETGFGVDNPGQLYLSDMTFAIGSGSYAMQVAGASDSHFWNLYASGPAAAGAVLVNGDDATEQHWSDIMLRDVGGTAFGYTRTTATDTGGLYLDRVRIVGPPSSATHGFSFTATGAAVGVAADVFMSQCVADNYYNDAMLVSGLSKLFVTNSWFAMNAAANSGQVALHITGGYDQVYGGCYTVNLLPSSTVVKVDGSAHEIQIGGGSVFDGGSGCTALGLAGAGSGGFSLGAHQNYCATLTDTPGALSVNSGATAPPTFQTAGGGGSGGTIGIDDTANPGTQKWLRVSNGTLQVLNTAFSAAIMQLTDAGALSLAGSLDIPTAGQGLKVAEGSNAKQGTATLNGTTAVVVSNTAVTANSRIFLTIQSPGGVTPGTPYVSTRTAGTSFSLKSTVASDNSVVAYELFEPG